MILEKNRHIYEVKIFKEDEISWKLQNKIHEILNISFEGISSKFIAKTYGQVRPVERILGFLDSELVAHLGISRDSILLNNNKIDICCLGLWASTRGGWAIKIMNYAIDYLKSIKIEIALGITNNKIILNKVLPKIDCISMNVRVLGKNYASKASDSAILFPISISDEKLLALCHEISIQQIIKLQGEPF